MSFYDVSETSTARLLYRVKALETGNLRLRRGAYGPVTGPFSRSRNLSLDSVGNVDPTKTGVLKKGALPPTANTNGFAYTSTANSIHWYWDGTNGSTIIQIRRSDGSQVVVKPGDINITGLVGATTYYFFPFWVSNGKYDVGWVIGKHGSPKIAFLITDLDGPDEGPAAAAKQVLQDREQLTNGAMTAATGGSGSPGGGGDPTGGGACVLLGTQLAALGNTPLQIEEFAEEQWVYLRLANGMELTCTVDHNLYHGSYGKTPAICLTTGNPVITSQGEVMLIEKRECRRQGIKLKVIMDFGHLYFANGFLSHNAKTQRK